MHLFDLPYFCLGLDMGRGECACMTPPFSDICKTIDKGLFSLKKKYVPS